jgi:hypothetical protein
MDNYNT